jgi:hypothetical protein
MTETANPTIITFVVEITEGNYYLGKFIVGYFDKTDVTAKIDFHKCETVQDMFKTDEGEAKGFLKHLANSIRKRCRDGNWHLAPKPFTFVHLLMSDKSTIRCLVKPQL